jgi:hypothetical protein
VYGLPSIQNGELVRESQPVQVTVNQNSFTIGYDWDVCAIIVSIRGTVPNNLGWFGNNLFQDALCYPVSPNYINPS